LEADLLGVEVEFWGEDLWDLDCEEDGSEVEYYAICDSWNQDVRICEERYWSEEIICGERLRTDTAEVEVFALER
jgi:hypothetical protein